MPAFNIPDDDLIDANIYVVTEIGWEYNDEYFYRPESEGGTPVNAFTVRALAEEFCKTKCCEWFIDGLANYYENPAHFLNGISYKSVENTILEYEIDGLEYDGMFRAEDPKRLKYDEIWELIKDLGLEQYEVVAVKLMA